MVRNARLMGVIGMAALSVSLWVELRDLEGAPAQQVVAEGASRQLSPGRSTAVQAVIEAARSQVGVTVRYDPAYQTLRYPGGDVPREGGVCTDVIIRALRDGLGIDLQKEVHEDMARNFSLYPQKWGLKRPDRSIDHRRVPNLMTWLRRKGYEVPAAEHGKVFLPGDLVTCTVSRTLPHIMILSDRMNTQGEPLVLHNIGQGTQEEDRLREFPLTGHYRLPPGLGTAGGSSKGTGGRQE